MNMYMYLAFFAVFYFLTFRNLKAIKIERAFTPGKTFEIISSYIILSCVISYILTELIDKIISM